MTLGILRYSHLHAHLTADCDLSGVQKFHSVAVPGVGGIGIILGVLIGLLMPKVTYPDGSLQHLCKLLPTPIDFLIRRCMVGPLAGVRERLTQHFELRFTGYAQEMHVPFLSGCFMLLKIKALRQVGIFDESFFMCGEDIDLSRRIHTEYITLFFPAAYVVHDYAKASYKRTKMLLIHMMNIARYFNKWGWIFDSQRKKVNAETLKELKKLNKPSQ